MSLPIVCIPPVINKHLEVYRPFFSKPQFSHFGRLVTGHIVCENTILQEINDCFGKCEQSNLNRFVSCSAWDLDEVNKIRLNQVKNSLPLRKKGVQIIDESLLHKTGPCMELAGYHRSGVTKRIEWGHMAVNSFYTDSQDNDFPIKTDIYVREQDCSKYGNIAFKTKRELALEQIDFALENNLPVGLVLVDAGYEGEKFTQKIQSKNLDFIIGVRTTTNISIDRQKRISIGDYLSTLTDLDFEFYLTKEKAYFYHIKQVSIRGIGAVKLVISFMHGDEKNIKCYITNLQDDKTIIKLLIKRWRIECFHRDAKQHLGLEAYQVRKGRGMQVVALATLVAYTLVILIANILKTPIRKLKTIGEVCRYLALIAYKGIRWISCLIKKPLEFIKTLKKHVFVKNTKV